MSRTLSILRCAAALVLTAGGTLLAQELPNAPTVAAVIGDAGANALSGNSGGPMVGHGSAMIATMPAKLQTHRFFDKTNFAVLSVAASALLADGITTQNRLGQVHTEYQRINGVSTPVQMRITEADPIGKLFVNHGWPGTIAGGAFSLGTDLGVQYLLHRKNHHRLERVVPLLFAASNAFAAIHNTRY